jgi:non-ribosomal peptide synthetase component F
MFGNAVSGRSAVIPKIDSAVGLFVNVLPVRALVPADGRVGDWLHTLQKQQAQEMRYEFCSLASIHGWSDVPRSEPLFESVIVCQNYPDDVAVPESAGIEVVNIEVIERSNVPLALVPKPASRLLLKIVYMGSRFEDATIDRILENLTRILIELTTNAEAPLASISYQADDEKQSLIDSFNQSLSAF